MNTATEKINKELTNLEPDTILELFEIDFSSLQSHIDMLKLKDNLNIGSEAVYRFHAGKNLSNPIYWQGNGYQPIPIVFEGMESKGDGTLPRPKLSVLNIDGLLSRIISSNDDFVGCTVTRKRTFAKFLDGKNFQNRNLNDDGLNPFGRSDPQAHLPDDIFFINRKVIENQEVIQFELSSALELGNTVLPGRVVTSDYCTWKYRCVIGCRYGMNLRDSYPHDGLPRSDSNDRLFVDNGDGNSWGLSEFNITKSKQILEWNRLGVKKNSSNLNDEEGDATWSHGTPDEPSHYKRGDVVKISPTYAKTQVDEVIMVFVCLRTHGDPAEFHPFLSKDVWVRDNCSKTVQGCMVRYGYESTESGVVDTSKLKTPAALPFGGFPGVSKFPSS